jgi:hypothetical protein
MTRKLVILYFIILTLFPLSIHGEEEDYTDSKFYETSDPATWDYSQVDWSKVPENRIPEVPPERLDYASLTKIQRWSMTPEQIAVNFDNIEDLTSDVNGEAVQEAIQNTYGVTVDVGDGSAHGGVQLQDGVLKAKYGFQDYVSLDKVSDTTTVRVDGLGNILLLGETKPPSEGVYTVVYKEETTIETNNGKQANVNGKLSFSNGQAYVATETVVINGIEIKNTDITYVTISYGTGEEEKKYVGEVVEIYFDGKEHEGNYVSMNTEKGIMRLGNTDGDYSVRYTPDNTFFHVEENDYLEMHPGTGVITIEKRQEGIIPLVTVAADADKQGMLLTNGNQLYTIEYGEFKYIGEDYNIPQKKEGSVPFTLRLEDQAGNDLLSDQKVIFDNSKNFFVVPQELPSETVECISCVIDLSQSTTLFDYYQAKIQKAGIKGIRAKEIVPIEEADPNNIVSTFQRQDEDGVVREYAIVTKTDVAAMSKVISMLDELPPEVRESVAFIDVVPDEQVGAMCGGPNEILGCAQQQTRTITVGESTSYETLYHEAAHALTYNSERDTVEEKDLKRYELELRRKYDAQMFVYTDFERDDSGRALTDAEGKYIPCDKNDFDCFTAIAYDNMDNPLKIELSKDELKKYVELRDASHASVSYGSNSGTFEERWKAIAGDVYGKELGESIVGDQNAVAVTWDDGSSMPRYGCIRAYGCNNYYEDVATFVEPVADGDFSSLQVLVNPDSDYYTKTYPVDEQTAKEWATRYKQKLDLLYEFGFIKGEDYQKIIGDTK